MKNMKKILAITCIMLMLTSSLMVFADIGPKDELVVNVINPPEEKYYLDIMTTDGNYESNLSKEDLAKLDQDMLEIIKNVKSDNWHSAYTGGTSVPMWGNIEGVEAGQKMIHTFGYVGLPDTCKIVVVTESGTIKISEEFTRKSLHSSVQYDFESNEVTSRPILLAYLSQFILTCLATLIIEIFVLILFKFDLKKNLKLVIIVNIITQIILTVTMGTVLIRSGGLAAYIVQVPAEIAIICIEMYVYSKKLQGHTPKRRKLYALLANLLSWGIGILMVVPIFSLLDKIL